MRGWWFEYFKKWHSRNAFKLEETLGTMYKRWRGALQREQSPIASK
jgi:hypothetical protein